MLNENIKKQLNINSDLGVLNLSNLTIELDHATKEAYSLFESDQTTPGIILLQGTKFAGMISRKCFFEIMSKPYSMELFLKRSIETFYQDMESENSLLIPVTTLISTATIQALQRDPKEIYEPIVVIMNDGTYQILDIDQLLLAQSIIHSQTLEQLKKNVNYVKNLLNNSGQGFLTIKNDLYIESQYSNECKNIFGFEIEKMFFPKLIFPFDEKQQLFLSKILIRIMNEKDKSITEKYLPLLPEETIIEGKTININYKLIKNIDSNGKRKFMIILTDITEKRNLENQIDDERNILKMVVKIIINYNDFNGCVKEYQYFYRYKLNEIFESTLSLEEIILEVFRQIHTFKGNFSQIDLVNIVKKLHRIESEISRFNENKSQFSLEDFKMFMLQFNLPCLLDEDLNILKAILGDNFFNDFNIVKVGVDKLREIENRLCSSPYYDELEDIIMDIRRLRSKNIKDLLAPLADYSIRLGNKLNKNIKLFSIEGDDVFLNQEEYGGFFKSLVHIFRNAVDHGIEDPDKRVLKGKSDSGEIQCDIKLSDNNFIIRISDDGKGIDLVQLRNKLLTKDIVDKNRLDSMENSEIIRYIFKNNVSTKDFITELSGRGIGLSAVYSEVEKLGGTIEVKSGPDQGTEFIITIPFRKFINSAAFESVDILGIIVKTTQSFLKNEINFKEVLIDSLNEYEKERLTLNTFSSFIGIKGKTNAKVIITIEYKLAKHLLKHFINNDYLIEDEQKYLEDTVSETLNNIIGNSTKELSENGKSIEFGTPVIMTSEEAIFKYPPTKKWNCRVRTEEGDFLLYIIQG